MMGWLMTNGYGQLDTLENSLHEGYKYHNRGGRTSIKSKSYFSGKSSLSTALTCGTASGTEKKCF